MRLRKRKFTKPEAESDTKEVPPNQDGWEGDPNLRDEAVGEAAE